MNNVHADDLATNYLDNYAKPSKLVPFIPASQASLMIHGETITQRFARHLRPQASANNSPRLICKKGMARNGWTRNTFRFHQLGCPWKGTGHSAEQRQKIFIVKLAHDHLPSKYLPTHASNESAAPHMTNNAQQSSTLLKPTGIFSAVPTAPSGEQNFSAPWAIHLSPTTRS
jgi:hypothetical protein